MSIQNKLATDKTKHEIGLELPPKYDVSIILNLHNEARYLRRTLRSLEEAVRYARQFDITFEIVVVLDNADKVTTQIAETFDYRTFDAYQIIHANNKSLGLSRNDGMKIAQGEYITTSDADDLIGFDFLQKLYMTASSNKEKTIVFPEYCIGFGATNYAWKFYSIKNIGFTAFFERHPYLSRLLFRRDILKDIKYVDASHKSGFAYEDWHFNCECIAAGCSIKVATDAILFYRQRPESLLKQSNATTSRLIPQSRFFEPSKFLKLTWAEIFNSQPIEEPSAPFDIKEYLNRSTVLDIFFAANRIDPAINIELLKECGHGASNYTQSPSLGAAAYFQVCSEIVGQKFTDVILLPFMAKGGAEKYILSILEALGKEDPDARFLFLFGQNCEKHDWLDKLPANSHYIDLCSPIFSNLSQEKILLTTFRTLQNLCGQKRIHIKTCEYGHEFLRKYARLIQDYSVYYYYFCDQNSVVDGYNFINGYSYDIISEYLPYIDGVISDHKNNLKFIAESIGAEYESKFHTIYTTCAQPKIQSFSSDGPTHRLLWASRIDKQKRAELLVKIAKKLAETLPDVQIDIYGKSAFGKTDSTIFNDHNNLKYKGEFNGLASIASQEYDAFLYTSYFDGLPNVLLEAAALELPIIAPDIGGIAELISNKTGFLIENCVEDETIVENYAVAIQALYSDWSETIRRRQNALNLVSERHSDRALCDRVHEVFNLQPPEKTPSTLSTTATVAIKNVS